MRKRHRIALRFLVSFLFWSAVLAAIGYYLLAHPSSPLPDHWNPRAELRINAPATPVTRIQLRHATRDAELCRAILSEAGIGFDTLPDKHDSDTCHIRGRISLRGLGSATIDPVETRCATALRLAMWVHHVVQPEAQAHFSEPVSWIGQIGSYNCRRMRTAQGASEYWSHHASADAIDITGFNLSGGRRIRLTRDWDDPAEAGAFLRAVRDGACDWFRQTLSPDYNSLHADHFHLQSGGWGLCR